MARVVIPYKPRPAQQEMHNGMENHRWSVIVAHRRCGKTVAVINHLIKQALLCQRDKPRYGYIAPLYSQAKAIAWDYLKHFTGPIPGVKANESELWIQLPNWARIRLFGADNPDALRGLYFDGVALDEVAQMKPQLWSEVVRPALTDREGFAVFIGTPRGVNQFHDLYRHAIRTDGWYAGEFLASRTGVIPDEELAAARSSMSESQYLQEFQCDFSASVEDSLIPISLAEEAAQRTIPTDAFRHAPKVIGVDVARFGDDKSVIICRQGLVAYGLRKYRDMDTMRLSDVVVQVSQQEQVDAIFVDTVGLGAGVVDRLRQLGHRPIDVNAGSSPGDDSLWLNKRAEMWCSMKDWLKDGAIPDDLELKSDLVSARYSYDNRNRIVLERKSDMKKRGLASPDCADALALTFAQPVRVMSDREIISASIQTKSYDPTRLFGRRH